MTMDLTWGTKKVKVLNVSHNYINEIRPGKNKSKLAPQKTNKTIDRRFRKFDISRAH
jgi:hypothetical protein